jgi:hypothetical protein
MSEVSSESEHESDMEEEDQMDIDVPVFEATEAENEIKRAREKALKKLQEQEQGTADGAISAERQLSYLMSQSEVFAHFLNAEGEDDAPTSDKRKSKKKSSGGLGGGVGRTRMSEEAEDRRLMKLAQSKGVDVSRVSEQPQTIAGM